MRSGGRVSPLFSWAGWASRSGRVRSVRRAPFRASALLRWRLADDRDRGALAGPQDADVDIGRHARAGVPEPLAGLPQWPRYEPMQAHGVEGAPVDRYGHGRHELPGDICG